MIFVNIQYLISCLHDSIVFQVDIQNKYCLSDVVFPITAESSTYNVNDSFSQVKIPYQHLEDRQTEGLF